MAQTMTAGERREAILRELEQAQGPVSASALAKRFHVSRQAVVGDVAMLRAAMYSRAERKTRRRIPSPAAMAATASRRNCTPSWTTAARFWM